MALTTWDYLQDCGNNNNNCNVTTFTAPSDPHTTIITLPTYTKGTDPYTPTLTLISPVCSQANVAFFGEIDKFATVSIQRFTSISCTSTGIQVTMSGLTNESVRLAWYSSSVSGVTVRSVTFANKGPAPRVTMVCNLQNNGQMNCM